jgi:hypothetical protein
MRSLKVNRDTRADGIYGHTETAVDTAPLLSLAAPPSTAANAYRGQEQNSIV